MPDISKIQFPNGDEYNIKDASAVHDHMVILSYGHSTWQDFIDAYDTNTVVYCRASSNSNPATGSQTRLAFMAYVNNATTPTNVEFQYYRSMSAHTASQQGDQVFVYKLDKTSGWSVTTRQASSKIVAGDGLSSVYTTDTVTLAADVLSVNNQTGAVALDADNLDYDSTYTIKGKIDTIIASGGEPNVIETVQQNGSALPVSNKTVNVTVPTKTSDLTNDSNFVSDANYVHTDNNFTSTLKTKLEGIASGAEVNQNAFSNVKVGSTTIAADSKTDTLELVAGNNVTLTPDATNDKITIAATDTTYESKAAASGGTAVSLVTTGEKYTWNNKQNAITFDGTYSASTNKAATVSTVTNAINALDGGTIGTGGTTKTITSLSQTNGNVSATFSNIAFPVTSVNTKTGAVTITAEDLGLSQALKFIGVSSTEITDGGTEEPTIPDYTGTAKTIGNVVIYGNLEFVWSGSAWEQLGDDRSFVVANPTITAGTATKITYDAKGLVTAGASLNSTDVTTALGYTPYNSTNPNGYITSSALTNYMQKGVDYVTAGKKSGTTLGNYATAEGYNTTASGNYSHAEGYNTTVLSVASHAEGGGSTAMWSGAHAEGGSTVAKGEGSHAEGMNTIAKHRAQHVFGEGNIEDPATGLGDTKGTYIEIVGNGSESSGTITRSNARTLDWSGNETLAGKLTVGAAPTADMDVATKQYVDTTNVNTTYTFTGGTNSFKVTPSGGTAQTVTVTPSITNNVTGSGTSGYLTKFNGANTITNGPQLGTADGTYLNKAGSWATPPNTTYTFSGGVNKFTVVPSDTGVGLDYTITPSIANNVTGSGTSGYIAKFNGTNTITNGPAFGSATTTYLRNDGSWATPTDTKNTAGSTASDSKMFLIGATNQAANPQTYANANIYGTAGVLNAKSYSINAAANIVYNSTDKSIDFTFN